MTLTAEQIRALAPAPGYRQIDRYIPDPYRRALGDTRTPLAVLTKSWRDGLKRLDHELGLVQRSRSVRFFSDLDDGGRLGALHDQVLEDNRLPLFARILMGFPPREFVRLDPR